MKNYIICVGGSGARVLRAVIHMSACGLLAVEELEVIIIDPDKDTMTTSLAVQELKDYQELRRLYGGNRILQSDILHFAQKKNDSYIISPVEEEIKTLRDLCGTEQDMEELMHWFFKEEEIEQNLEKGFYARPAVGAAFFSNFEDKDFIRFLDNIIGTLRNQEEVNLIMTGSIFGGTGASGIPTILKLIGERLEAECAKGIKLYKNLNTGAVFILPYFNVLEAENQAKNDPNISIQVGSFSGNTKEALNYYDIEGYYGKMSHENCRKFENIYLVGQEVLDEVSDYAVGSAAQKNKAHVVELYAALAVSDFFGRMIKEDDPNGKDGIFVYARNDIMTWKDFPVPFGYKEGSVRQKIAAFIRFSTFFNIFIYESLYDSIKNGTDGVNIYKKNLFFRKEQWYYRLINEKDSNLKTNMNCIRTYCVDFLNWIFEIHSVRKTRGAVLNRDKLVLNRQDMDLVGECYEELHQFLMQEKYELGEEEFEDLQYKARNDVTNSFQELITEEEKKTGMKRIISKLNDSPMYKENYVTQLIDRICDVLKEEYE